MRLNTKEEADTEIDAQVEIDEEVMMHMFHVFAAYRPVPTSGDKIIGGTTDT
jgi:hypothetical protein